MGKEKAVPWIFVRHGESTANCEKILAGWNNVALTSVGVKQATEVGKSLRNIAINRVLCSDLDRAKDTASHILEHWSATDNDNQKTLPPISYTANLRERHLSFLQGQSLEKIRADRRNLLLLGWTSAPEGGESHYNVAKRTVDFLFEHRHPLPSSDASHTNDHILCVAHGGTLRSLFGLLDHLPTREIGNVSVPNCDPVIRLLTESDWMMLKQKVQSESAADQYHAEVSQPSGSNSNEKLPSPHHLITTES